MTLHKLRFKIDFFNNTFYISLVMSLILGMFGYFNVSFIEIAFAFLLLLSNTIDEKRIKKNFDYFLANEVAETIIKENKEIYYTLSDEAEDFFNSVNDNGNIDEDKVMNFITENMSKRRSNRFFTKLEKL